MNQNLTIKLRDVDRSLKTISPREARDNNCFITTACVKHYGLSDDCYQLNTLRKFRDGYLSKSDANKTLIHQYYSIAPNLVNLLESDINRNHLFNEIFLKINRACAAIEKRKFENAKKIYSDAVVNLLRYFKNAS